MGFLLLVSTAVPCLGVSFAEIIIYDSVKGEAVDEGLVRQRLGLLNADGKPTLVGGVLPPLVNADSTKAAYDMKGGAGTGFEAAVLLLAGNNGTITLITHGGVGAVVIDGNSSAGILENTGGEAQGCIGCPVTMNTLTLGASNTKQNVTLNLVVCYAAATSLADGVNRSVATTLGDAIRASGGMGNGSVKATIATKGTAAVGIRVKYKPATSVTLTENDSIKLGDTLKPFVTAAAKKGANAIKFEDQYDSLQTLFDKAIGENKAVPKITYSGRIGSTIITVPFVTIETFAIAESNECDSCIVVTGIDGPPRSNDVSLGQSVPNPFNPTTRIPFHLDRERPITLTVYNSMGQLVRTLASGRFPAGDQWINWDGTDHMGTPVASGVYFYRLTTGTTTLTHKMVLLK